MSINYPSEIEELLRLGQSFEHVPKAEASVAHLMPAMPVVSIRDISVKKFPMAQILLYPAIFVAAFVFFYTVLNFSSLTSQVAGWFAKPQDEQILGDSLTAYYNWIGGYYFSVADLKLLEPNNDIDKDGLTNMDEFTIKTNPIIADSDSDGFSDGIEIINGYNPWGAGRLTLAQSKLSEGMDLIKINNRISYNASAAAMQPRVLSAQTLSFDTSKPGTLSIPKLNLQVPIVWSSTPADFETDLTRGVVHYPGTAMPGELGTVYISGHSSDYLWKKNPFSQVFARINALSAGDDIFVDVYDLEGKVHSFRYKVVSENVYKPDDQAQFIDNSGEKLNLSTCWPIGTQKDRYVVSAVRHEL